MIQERINYCIDSNGWYCGHCVNVPIVMQAKSVEEMKRRAAIMLKSHIQLLQQILDSEEPFDLKEFTPPEYEKIP